MSFRITWIRLLNRVPYCKWSSSIHHRWWTAPDEYIQEGWKTDTIVMNQRQGEGDNAKIMNRLMRVSLMLRLIRAHHSLYKRYCAGIPAKYIADVPQAFPLIVIYGLKTWTSNHATNGWRFQTLVPPDILAKNKANRASSKTWSTSTDGTQEMQLNSNRCNKVRCIANQGCGLQLKKEKNQLDQLELQ